MRKLLGILLGLSLLAGSAAPAFAAGRKHPKVKHRKIKHRKVR